MLRLNRDVVVATVLLIAGGVLLFLIAIDMVFARQSGGRSATGREQEEARHKEAPAVRHVQP